MACFLLFYGQNLGGELQVPASFFSYSHQSTENKKRIRFLGMFAKYATPDGAVSDHLLRYDAARVAGGAGLVAVEASSVCRGGILFQRSPPCRQRGHGGFVPTGDGHSCTWRAGIHSTHVRRPRDPADRAAFYQRRPRRAARSLSPPTCRASSRKNGVETCCAGRAHERTGIRRKERHHH